MWTGQVWKSMYFLRKQKALSEVMITLHIPRKELKKFSFTWEMHFRIVTVQLLSGGITDQLLEMGSEIRVTNVTSLQHCALGPVSGREFGWMVYLLNCEAAFLRPAQGGWKPPLEVKSKSLLDLDFQYEYRLCKRGLIFLLTLSGFTQNPKHP